MAKSKNILTPNELDCFDILQARGLYPVGIDLAARVFQVCYFDVQAKRLKNVQLSRDKFKEFILEAEFNFGHILAVFEACGACNYWARFIEALGHQVKIISAQAVLPFKDTSDKNDDIDARAIFLAAISPFRRNVIKVKTEQEQVIANLFTIRANLIKQRTQTLNAYRAMIYELGGVSDPRSTKGLLESGNAIIEELESRDSKATDSFKLISSTLTGTIKNIDDRVDEINKYLDNFSKHDPIASKFISIPGVGPIVATALFVAMGSPDNFENSKNFAAYVGMVPKVSGSGGKVTTGRTRKACNALVKPLLYFSAMAYISYIKKHDLKGTNTLLKKFNAATHKKTVLVAIANKIARTAWSLAKNDTTFDPKRSRL